MAWKSWRCTEFCKPCQATRSQLDPWELIHSCNNSFVFLWIMWPFLHVSFIHLILIFYGPFRAPLHTNTIHLKLRCLMSNRPWSSSPCSRLAAFVMSQRQNMVMPLWFLCSVACLWMHNSIDSSLGVAAFVRLGSSSKMRDLALSILQPRTHSQRQISGNEALVLRIFGVLSFEFCNFFTQH